MDRPDDPAEERDPGDVGRFDHGNDRADRAHPVNAGVRRIGGHDEGDREQASEAHAEQQPAAEVAQPGRERGRRRPRARVKLEHVAGQVLAHGGNDDSPEGPPERTGGWDVLPRRY